METISHQCPQGYTLDYKQLAKTHEKQYKTVSQQDVIIEEDSSGTSQSETDSNDEHPSIMYKMFFSYLYFSQGLLISLCATTPYIYPTLPSYSIMAIFSISLLPFSFKFILAPLTQRYTVFAYGKRKFWIILAQSLAAGCLFVAAFYTGFQESEKLAIIFFVMILFVTLQDISLDSLAKKELRHAHITSSVTVTNQLTGSIIGSTLLLKLTSVDFAQSIGLQHSICSLTTYLIILGLIILIPTMLIHFTYTQTVNDQELKSTLTPLHQIYCSYRIFFNLNSKYCRTVLLILIANQGFNFFLAGYDYQLVKAGFSRNTNNTIQNVVAIPVNIIACFMTAKIQTFGIKKGIATTIIGQLLIFSFLRLYFPLDVYTIAFSTFFASILGMWFYMITVIFIYEFPLHRFTGVYLTFLASANNLGGNTTLHTKVLDMYGWWNVSLMGICIQLVILVVVYFWMLDWKDEGKLDLEDQIIIENQNKNNNTHNDEHFKNIPTTVKS